jgi:hypothetical protein
LRLGPDFFTAGFTLAFDLPVFFASYRTSWSCSPATRTDLASYLALGDGGSFAPKIAAEISALLHVNR